MSKKQDETSVTGFFGDKLSPEVWESVAFEEALARLSLKAAEVAEACGLSRREIAQRMGQRSPSTVQRIVGTEADNVTVGSLLRFAQACGHELHISFAPRQRVRRSVARFEIESPEETDGAELDLAA